MGDDIVSVLNAIKEKICLVEDGYADAAVLDEIAGGSLRLMELIKLFLISERDSYYGYFLMNLHFRANFQSHSIAGIRLGEFPPVLETNPLLLCEFTLKEILYIVCHEIDHIVLNHPAEMVKANPAGDPDVFYRFNLAADAAVNDRLNHEIRAEGHRFMKAPDGIITSVVLARQFRLGSVSPMESYAYYFDLIQNKKGKGRNGAPENGQASMLERQLTKGKGGRGDKGQGGAKGGADQPVVTAADAGALVDHDWGADADAEDATAAVRELVNAAVSMMHPEVRGCMPAHFMSQVEVINRPPVLSWQAILKKYVGTITANKRKTRMRLNRRQPERFDLSGTVDDKVLKIVVAIDTSASVSDRMISQIMNEIFAILAKRRHDITVIECDAEIQRVYKAKTPADIQQKVAGRGGTWFSPVIEYINQDKYFRDALLIYFTDGYGEQEIPKPRTYRNIWVVFQDARNLSLTEPYGTVLTR